MTFSVPRELPSYHPHRPWDCAIDLISGEPVPPHGKIYPLSLPEQKAMEDYIEEAVETGLHRLFHLPCCFQLLLRGKEGRGLRPCIDYRKLNENHCKIPVILFSLSQPPWNNYAVPPSSPNWTSAARTTSSASVKGTNGKTAFVTPTGHYEYKSYAVWTSQCSLNLPRLYALGASGSSFTGFVIVYIE